MNDLLIAGFGNTLMGDDGAGIEVVRRIASRKIREGVRVVEEPGDSLLLPRHWKGETRVWLVDALIGGKQPGTIHRLDHANLMAVPQRHATVHHLSLPESIRWITLTFPDMANIRYELWGIEPGRLFPGEGFTPAVEIACDNLAEIMISEANSQ